MHALVCVVYRLAEERGEYLRCGMDSVIQKPLQVSTLSLVALFATHVRVVSRHEGQDRSCSEGVQDSDFIP